MTRFRQGIDLIRWMTLGETRLWISVKVAGLKLNKYGGMIGKRWGSGNQMSEIWNECVQLCHWKIGGINWQMIVCQVCHAGDELEGLQWNIEFKVSLSVRGFFENTIFGSSQMYPENPEGTQVIVRRVNEHGIYIRHCQESNSQPDPSQAGGDTTRPEWRVGEWFCERYIVTVSDSWNNAVQSFLFHLNQIQILGSKIIGQKSLNHILK